VKSYRWLGRIGNGGESQKKPADQRDGIGPSDRSHVGHVDLRDVEWNSISGGFVNLSMSQRIHGLLSQTIEQRRARRYLTRKNYLRVGLWQKLLFFVFLGSPNRRPILGLAMPMTAMVCSGFIPLKSGVTVGALARDRRDVFLKLSKKCKFISFCQRFT
jgi:hypothetical protein